MSKAIPLIIAFLAAYLTQHVGLDAHTANLLSVFVLGAVVGIAALVTKDKYLLHQSQEIIQPLKPTTEDLLGELEWSIEQKFNIKIDDEIKLEIVALIFGEDHKAEWIRLHPHI